MEIQLEEVWKNYRDRSCGVKMPDVLRGISLTIKQGEYLAITGTSGCGKTTFLNISLLSFFLSYIFISYVSPNGSYQTTQMIVYLAWGVYLKKDFYCVDYSYDSYIYYPYRS